MNDTPPSSSKELLQRLRSFALGPMPRGQFELIRDAVHALEDLSALVEPMSAIVHWYDECGRADESWWQAAREALAKLDTVPDGKGRSLHDSSEAASRAEAVASTALPSVAAVEPPADIETLVNEFAHAVRQDAYNSDRYSNKEMRDCEAALLAAMRTPPPSGPYCSWCQSRLPEHAPACDRPAQPPKTALCEVECPSCGTRVAHLSSVSPPIAGLLSMSFRTDLPQVEFVARFDSLEHAQAAREAFARLALTK